MKTLAETLLNYYQEHEDDFNHDIEELDSWNGIKAFTYSCRATDAVETLWLFKQAGCTIGEMVEVNIRKDFYGKDYEKGHAFRMTLN